MIHLLRRHGSARPSLPREWIAPLNVDSPISDFPDSWNVVRKPQLLRNVLRIPFAHFDLAIALGIRALICATHHAAFGAWLLSRALDLMCMTPPATKWSYQSTVSCHTSAKSDGDARDELPPLGGFVCLRGVSVLPPVHLSWHFDHFDRNQLILCDSAFFKALSIRF